jgi:hypothetical protein
LNAYKERGWSYKVGEEMLVEKHLFDIPSKRWMAGWGWGARVGPAGPWSVQGDFSLFRVNIPFLR